MNERRYHIAQVNVGILKEPLDSPRLADFVAWLDPINAIADQSRGFVWRLQTDEGNATALRIFADSGASILVNMSVWESIEALVAYVYSSAHVAVLRRRREWFEKLRESHMALWWVAAGHHPSIAEAEDRLGRLREVGPTPYAFTFDRAFAAGGLMIPFDARSAYRRPKQKDISEA